MRKDLCVFVCIRGVPKCWREREGCDVEENAGDARCLSMRAAPDGAADERKLNDDGRSISRMKLGSVIGLRAGALQLPSTHRARFTPVDSEGSAAPC